MSKKYFVANNTGRDIEERKPGVGVFKIVKDGKLECSKEVAESIVRDFVSEGLSVVEEDKPEPRKPVAPPRTTMTKDPSSFRERVLSGKRQENK